MNRDRNFYGWMAIVAAVVTLTGFASVYVPHASSGSVPAIIHVHALVFTSWLALFVIQTQLVAARRTQLHRRLGTAAMFLAGAMLIVGVLTAREAARSGHTGVPGLIFPNPAGFLLLNIVAATVFGVLVTLGWAYRNRPQVHKRLMLMATVAALMPPGISRLPLIAGNEVAIAVTALVFLFIPSIHDWVTRRRVHPAYVFSIVLALMTIPPVVTALAATQAWQRIAAWMIG